jgi:hypothetical protein
LSVPCPCPCSCPCLCRCLCPFLCACPSSYLYLSLCVRVHVRFHFLVHVCGGVHVSVQVCVNFAMLITTAIFVLSIDSFQHINCSVCSQSFNSQCFKVTFIVSRHHSGPQWQPSTDTFQCL